jgi:peptidoglycan/xylan/chitin deacetylase (PgdA/CDA1 family)
MVFRSLSFVRSEIDRTDLLLRGLGVTGDIHFRSPYGAQLFSTPVILWQRGKKNILFDVDPRDWEMQDPSVLAGRILDSAKPGSIILLHDGGGDRSGTVRAVEMIIPELKRRDFRFVTVSELLAYAAK